MQFAVIVFPGSNCDHDCYHAIKDVLKQPVRFVWHKEASLGDAEVVILPGGFSYGDYLRAGAISRFSPIMKAVTTHAREGRPLLGICNGFQCLTESGLLPGALRRNESLRFVCDDVRLKCVTSRTPFTCGIEPEEILKMTIAHGEGNYFCDSDTLAELEDNDQIVFRYTDANGDVNPESNPNGSMENIAGICNLQGNVVGLMPHPERSCDSLLGGEDGLRMFMSVVRKMVSS